MIAKHMDFVSPDPLELIRFGISWRNNAICLVYFPWIRQQDILFQLHSFGIFCPQFVYNWDVFLWISSLPGFFCVDADVCFFPM